MKYFFLVQVGQTLHKAALEVPSTSSCSVLIVDGSSFGGSKLGMDHTVQWNNQLLVLSQVRLCHFQILDASY